MVYHITTRNAWQAAEEAGMYTHDSLETEGFIHLSTREQLLDTASRHFQGQMNLVLLEVDEDRLKIKPKYEKSPVHEDEFPHVYGPINLDAVVRVIPFPMDEGGQFELPGVLREDI